MSVDIDARKQLAEAINKYINDEIDNFEFDDVITDIKTKDKTVKWCVSSLWYCYDDLKQHRAVLSKREWDLLQRMLLLLDGSGEIEEATELIYPSENFILLSILGMMIAVPTISAWLQSGSATFVLWAFLSIGTIIVHVRKAHRLVKLNQHVPVLLPFGSIREIMAFRRRSCRFKKQKYRKEIKTRTIRHRILETDVSTIGYMLLVLIAPLVALAGILPARVCKTKIVAS